ncbi:MAG: hypothetical protein U0V87_12925 [Acidobacteriota bacterium]
MNRFLLCTGLAITGLAPQLGNAQEVAPAPSAPARPALVNDQGMLDLGTLLEGKEAVAQFSLKNTSSTEIKILRAAPS